MSDLAPGRIALEFRDRKRCRADDHAVHRETPVGEPSRLQPLVGFVLRRIAVGKRWFGNLTARKLTRQGVVGQYPLRRIGQRFARAIETAMIGWDQSITLRKTVGYGQARNARCCRDPGGDQFAAGEIAHMGSLYIPARPVIIARMRLLRPARQIMTM